jgi:hypothetical protein
MVSCPVLDTYAKAVPVPADIVAVELLVKESVLPPVLTLQGALAEQPVPIVSTVPLVLVTARVFSAPELELPPCKFHVFVAVHTYTLLPAGPDVNTYISPEPHVTGRLTPLLAGFV